MNLIGDASENVEDDAMAKDSSSFRVPVALGPEDEIVRPEVATKGTTYRCPGCQSKLVLHRGERRRPHYAHPASAHCSAESALHHAAKRLVAHSIAAGEYPEFHLECMDCRKAFEVPFPKGRTLAPVVEHRLNNRVVDVALLDGDKVALAVEILVTSKVDADKAADLSAPWIELQAKDVLENPKVWKAVQHGLKSTRCPTCRGAEKIHERLLVQSVARYGIEYHQELYRAQLVHCHKCEKAVPVFRWGGEMWTSKEPPTPRPRTLRLRRTQTVDTPYWANHCAACGAVFGDFYLRTMIPDFYYWCVDEYLRITEDG
jgi:ssDNA-binding Zn-finger/Zn-ribbon topoisomerase 1